MKKLLIILFLFSSIFSFSQNRATINLSNIKFCDLSVTDLKNQDSELKEVKVVEMDLCTDVFVQDSRYENSIGYESKLYPGVIFQKYHDDLDIIAKIHLTKEFKGYLPDGNYIDMQTIKASEVLKKYDSLSTWTSRGCSDYWGIKKDNQLNFYVKINKSKKPQYPVDEQYYTEQNVEGIDIISDCYTYLEKTKINPLYIIEGEVVNEDAIRNLQPEDVESIHVLKDKSAIEKYGDKGKNGVIEIYLKKK